MARRCFYSLMGVLWLLASAAGCERSSGNGAQIKAQPDVGVRIVSLSPAISRTLIDFHLQDRIVGRTRHCVMLDQSVPVVGDLLNIDYEALIRLQPTHLLVQPPASGIDTHLVELAKERGWVVGQWQLNGRDDIEGMVSELPATLFPSGSSELIEASRRSAEVLNQIAQALSPGTNALFRGRVLILDFVDPLLASGAGTYVHDIVTTFGATNAVTGRGWVQLTFEDVIRLNPEAILLIDSGGDANRSAMDAIGPVKVLPIDAIRSKRVAIVTNADGDLPSSGIIGLANEIRTLLKQFNEGTP